jgi:outer membrane protein OmpA-like peptidoglycan-associated protein
MDYRARIVAGTALALIMAAPPLSAAPLTRLSTGFEPQAPSLAFSQQPGMIILAQAEGEQSEDDLRRREREGRRQERREERRNNDEPTAAEPIPGQPEQPPAAEAPPETQAPRPPAEGERPPANEAPPQTEAPRPPAQGERPPAQPPAGGAEPIPGQPEQPPAGEAPPQTEAPRPPAQGEQPPAGGAEPIPGAPEQPPAGEAPPQTEAPRPPAQGERPPAQGERPPAQGERPPAQPPAGGAEPIPGAPEQPPAGEAPPQTEAPRPPAQGERPPAQGERPPARPPAGGAEPIPGAPDQPPAGEAPPQTEAPRPPAQGQRPPAGEAPPAQGERPPAQGERPPAAPGGVEPVQEGQAPILDSQKDERRQRADGEGRRPDRQPAEEAGPPPSSDAEAQEQQVRPREVESSREEEGRRIERRPERDERRDDADVVREIGDRIVIEFNNQIIVESDDRDRIGRNAEEVYYEELPRGRVRETVVRPGGVQVVTIRDRYGDVIQRSRIMPDGREYFLVYADDRGDGPREWRDPALDLPPLVLTMPAEEYILDAGRVEDPNVYYDFLDQPPVERVQRLYTIDEVKYSARVRDSVRRIDLDTITFEFGSASISEGEVPRLEGVAIAMERLLEENPAETFLIEGHTDAVGSNVANLALSDQRAESVAAALTNVFGIPPENLVTQGYGEEYLKVNTEEPERENRRVAMRRITPLVAPVASSQ